MFITSLLVMAGVGEDREIASATARGSQGVGNGNAVGEQGGHVNMAADEAMEAEASRPESPVNAEASRPESAVHPDWHCPYLGIPLFIQKFVSVI